MSLHEADEIITREGQTHLESGMSFRPNSSRSLLSMGNGASETTLQVKTLAARPVDVSLIPGMHMVEGGN